MTPAGVQAAADRLIADNYQGHGKASEYAWIDKRDDYAILADHYLSHRRQFEASGSLLEALKFAAIPLCAATSQSSLGQQIRAAIAAAEEDVPCRG